MNDLDKWAAEQCGASPEFDMRRSIAWFRYKGEACRYRWTIQDPRCREIVREHFNITTWYDEVGYWNASQSYFKDSDCIDYSAPTIAEAEIACIHAIKGAMNE